MKDHINVTLSLPESLMREFRVFAARKNRSMTAIMAEAIQERMAREGDESAREKVKRRFLARMRKGTPLGTEGSVSWTRDELHERS